jgi:hypothetical protein
MITLEKLCDDDTGINKNKCHNSLNAALCVYLCHSWCTHKHLYMCFFSHDKIKSVLYTSPEKMFPDTKGERTFNKRTAC